MNGSEAKHYSSDEANDVLMIATFAIPVSPDGGKPGSAPGQTVTISSNVVTKPSAGASPIPVSGAAKPGIRVAPPDGEGKGRTAGVWVASSTRKDGSGTEADQRVVVFGEGCPEPKRSGEGTVAGRAVFVIENDLSSCIPADAPDEIGGRHVRWVDQQTYLPLKMEMYSRTGQLVDRYEVTSIEYDVEILARVFTDLPAGTSVREPKLLPAIPAP
jgi:hypothetical protein